MKLQNPMKAPYSPWIAGGMAIGLITAAFDPFTGARVIGWVLTGAAGAALGYAAVPKK